MRVVLAMTYQVHDATVARRELDEYKQITVPRNLILGRVDYNKWRPCQPNFGSQGPAKLRTGCHSNPGNECPIFL